MNQKFDFKALLRHVANGFRLMQGDTPPDRVSMQNIIDGINQEAANYEADMEAARSLMGNDDDDAEDLGAGNGNDGELDLDPNADNTARLGDTGLTGGAQGNQDQDLSQGGAGEGDNTGNAGSGAELTGNGTAVDERPVGGADGVATTGPGAGTSEGDQGDKPAAPGDVGTETSQAGIEGAAGSAAAGSEAGADALKGE